VQQHSKQLNFQCDDNAFSTIYFSVKADGVESMRSSKGSTQKSLSLRKPAFTAVTLEGTLS